MSCRNKRKKGKIGYVLDRIKYDLRKIDLKAALIGGTCVLAGGLISCYIGGSPTFLLHMLKMPNGLPARWFFRVVWTLFYFLIGSAFANILLSKDNCTRLCKSRGNILFVVMLVFNYIWYPLFFGAEAIFFAFLSCIIISILDFFAACNYFKVNVICGSVLFLHLLWLIYALFLNAAIFFIN